MKRFVVALSVFALLGGACSSHTDHSEPASTTGTGHPAAQSSGRVGDTLQLTRADGSTVAVTLTQIINPATVAGGKGEPGKTYLATQLTLADTGTTAIEGAVNVNVSVVGSDGQTYTAELDDVTECRNFEAGTFHLDAGESATGCVVFALPSGVTPAKVHYKPSAGFAEDSGEWLVP